MIQRKSLLRTRNRNIQQIVASNIHADNMGVHFILNKPDHCCLCAGLPKATEVLMECNECDRQFHISCLRLTMELSETESLVSVKCSEIEAKLQDVPSEVIHPLNDIPNSDLLCCRYCIDTCASSAPLPLPDVPFANSFVDYLGPFAAVIADKELKIYIVIFTCTSTGAVHFEIGENLEVNSFLYCLRNFRTRRGKITRLYSTNGTNFAEADREMGVFVNEIHEAMEGTIAADMQIQWTVDPPTVSNIDGANGNIREINKTSLQRMIKSWCKKIHVGTLKLVLTGVEFIINSRPLTHIPIMDIEDEIHTPLYALRYHDGVNLQSNVEAFIQKRFKHALTTFWHCWRKLYVLAILKRNKLTKRPIPIKCNDFVITTDDCLPGRWLKGYVIEVNEQKHSLLIKTSEGVIKRILDKVVVLEVEYRDIVVDFGAVWPIERVPRMNVKRKLTDTGITNQEKKRKLVNGNNNLLTSNNGVRINAKAQHILGDVAQPTNNDIVTEPCPAMTSPIPDFPFQNSSIHYFGPFEVLKNSSAEKKWLVIFTCMSTRAVHIELADELDVNSFLGCLHNFQTRRGKLTHLYSDDGTNFLESDSEMQTLVNRINKEMEQRIAASMNIQWTSNPPTGSNIEGVGEKLIRIIKTSLEHMQSAWNIEKPQEETFRLVLTRVEYIINSRPLTKIPIKDIYDEVRTPLHALKHHGIEYALLDKINSSDTQYIFVTNALEFFWKHWSVQYLLTLVERKRNSNKVIPPKPNDIVIMADDFSPGRWLKGCVREVHMESGTAKTHSLLVENSEGIFLCFSDKVAVLKLKFNCKIIEFDANSSLGADAESTSESITLD